MGDNDTRAEALRIAFLEAKRKVAERVGTHVEVMTGMSEFALTRDEVRTYAAATMRVEIVEEEFLLRDGAFAVRVKVRAEVNPEDLSRGLERAARERSALEEVTRRADAARALEDRAIDLQRRIGEAQPEELPEFRREQAQVLRSLEEVQAEHDRRVEDAALLGEQAMRFVEAGMTRDDVVSLLGTARASRQNRAGGSLYECWYYGGIWIVLRDGVVTCKRTRLGYSQRYGGDCNCAGIVGTGEVFR
ncbi:hypothetical protein GGQ74_001311 [Desulfobaculum xiamenense]|uniref:Uncharacterized protein n=1 Tax=Desulfobaculum xiamenense TaxID=995050 RepID=A0A846QHI4_9BACT|nr:hypothetical protein [Desulfobaculum xiamenense]NJB67671.1 hypothetical protein [Desulfobaculum xiamenense]